MSTPSAACRPYGVSKNSIRPSLICRVAADGGRAAIGADRRTPAQGGPLAPYEVQVRAGGAWRTVATVTATADLVDKVTFGPVAADAVRLRIPATRFGGQNPKLAELAVTG